MQEACLALRINPIPSSTDSYDERHPQVGHPLHLAFYKGSGIRPLALGDLKYKLVMHLQEHLGTQDCGLECGMSADHRVLDEIGRRGLKRTLGRSTFAAGEDAEE